MKVMKKRAWIVVLTVFFAGVCLAWMQNKVVPLISVISQAFNAGSSTVGWLSSIFSLMAVVTALPSALILKKLGAKVCGLISLGCAIVGGLMGMAVNSIGLLMISRIIEGIGVGIISVVAPAVISMWFDDKSRGLPMGLWGSWQMVGQSAVFFCAVPLTSAFGWKGMWSAGIILCSMAFILFALLVKDPQKEYAPDEKDECSIWKGLRSTGAWLLGIAGFLFCCCCFGWVTWTVSAWSGSFGIPEQTVNTCLAYMFVLEIPMVILIGWLYDRFHFRRGFLGVTGALVYASLLFVGYQLPGKAFLLPYLLLYPFFEGMVATYLWTTASQIAKDPQDVGMTLAILTLCMNLGTVIGPPAVGAMIDAAGFSVAAGAMALCMVLGAGLICMVQPKPGKALSQ